ncbi:hypothetical protein GALL_462580 [mine drainage metagenome]|uniref:DUF2845 domain-containing protein n=1 Tax=mine drainage metagenome TaxID=410659 RepID=A0A1J5PWB4_9ZZZZ
MAKRTSKADAALIALVVVVGLPIFLVSKLVDSMGWVVPIIVVVAIIGLAIWYQLDKKQKRLEYLRSKYQDEEIVQKIVGGSIWQGQSEEQLKDAMGDPVSVDRTVLKTKTKEIWKYHQQGVNRFGLRITVENGYVVGWDKKA